MYIGFVIYKKKIRVTNFNRMTVFYNPYKSFSFCFDNISDKIYYHGLTIGEISLLHHKIIKCQKN